MIDHSVSNQHVLGLLKADSQALLDAPTRIISVEPDVSKSASESDSEMKMRRI